METGPAHLKLRLPILLVVKQANINWVIGDYSERNLSEDQKSLGFRSWISIFG